jgi:hypothetical protein
MSRYATSVYISSPGTPCKWERSLCLPQDGGRLQPARDRRRGHVDGRVIRDRRVFFIFQTLEGVARCLFSPFLTGLFTSSIHSSTVRIYTLLTYIHSITVRYIHSESVTLPTCIHSSTVLYIHSPYLHSLRTSRKSLIDLAASGTYSS